MGIKTTTNMFAIANRALFKAQDARLQQMAGGMAPGALKPECDEGRPRLGIGVDGNAVQTGNESTYQCSDRWDLDEYLRRRRRSSSVDYSSYSIPTLIASLRAGWNTGQREAIYALKEKGEEAVEPLIDALSHSNPNIREGAAQVFWRIEDERAVEPLFRTLFHDGVREVRDTAKTALHNIIGRVETEARIRDFRVKRQMALKFSEMVPMFPLLAAWSVHCGPHMHTRPNAFPSPLSVTPPETYADVLQAKMGHVFQYNISDTGRSYTKVSAESARELFTRAAAWGIKAADWTSETDFLNALKKDGITLDISKPQDVSDTFTRLVMEKGEAYSAKDPVDQVMQKFEQQVKSPYRGIDILAFAAHLAAYWRQSGVEDLEVKYIGVMGYFMSERPTYGSMNALRLLRQIETMLFHRSYRQGPVDKRIRALNHLLLAKMFYEKINWQQGPNKYKLGPRKKPLTLALVYARNAIAEFGQSHGPLVKYARELCEDIEKLMTIIPKRPLSESLISNVMLADPYLSP
jgi:hypothetical protein